MTILASLPTAIESEDVSWPRQGEWTYARYRELPDDGNRYEVIRGILHVSPAPSTWHQTVLGNLIFLLESHLRRHPIGKVFFAPVDVLLASVAAPVQPDVVFLRSEHLDRIKEPYVEGPPDLVIGVISPSSRKQDRQVKSKVYAETGVEEYWIVDPRSNSVEVFTLEGDRYELSGKYETGESAPSRVVTGFEAPIDEIFTE